MPYPTSLMRQDNSQDGTSRRSSTKATVYEAADVLGITVDAIRKRIQRGTIAYERDEDGRVYILLNGLEDVRDRSGNLQDNDQDAYRTTRDELVASLENQVEYLRGELAIRAEELRRKDHIIAALTERIPELEAPQGTREGHETASTHPEGVNTTQEDTDPQKGAQRPWWRRLLDI